MKPLFFIVIFTCFSLVTLGQQQPAPVSEWLQQNAQPLEVTYKTPVFKKPIINFGEFRLVESKRRGATSGSSGFQIYGIGPENFKGKQKGFVKISTPAGQEAEADLLYQEQNKSIKLGENSAIIYEEFADFQAFVHLPGSDRNALMQIHFDGLIPPKIEQPSGTLQIGTERLQIRCQLSSAGKLLGMDIPNGVAYEFVRAGQPVAAVSFTQANRSQVWLSQSLNADDRLLFSACITALLYRERMLSVPPSEASSMR